MPARLGFLGTMKVPFATLYQFTPTDGGKKMRSLGFVEPSAVYRAMAGTQDDRNFYVSTYADYRTRMERYDPATKRDAGQAARSPVDKAEWDLYLSSDTVFDRTVHAALDLGWTIDFVGKNGNKQALKRLEAKRAKGKSSITIWSFDGSIADCMQ